MADLFCEEKEGVLIARLVVAGRLSEQQIEDVGREMAELLDRSDGKILLDLRDVGWFSSLWLRRLITLQKKCDAINTDLRIWIQPTFIAPVRNKFHLDRVFKIHDSVEDALAAFQT